MPHTPKPLTDLRKLGTKLIELEQRIMKLELDAVKKETSNDGYDTVIEDRPISREELMKWIPKDLSRLRENIDTTKDTYIPKDLDISETIEKFITPEEHANKIKDYKEQQKEKLQYDNEIKGDTELNEEVEVEEIQLISEEKYKELEKITKQLN